jgi:two-component system cell cycle sensor histidine kinase/response regulator CckA
MQTKQANKQTRPTVALWLNKGTGPTGRSETAAKGKEVVLLVEDEDVVRGIARAILDASGYVVLEAANGREGLAVCAVHKGRIDLLITDVRMPELGGCELAESALRLRPQLKLIFMSGDGPDAIRTARVPLGTAFLQKPFTLTGLRQTVRETLDSRLAYA